MIKSEIDEGQTRFHLKRDLLNDDGKHLFDAVIPRVCALAVGSQRAEDEVEEE